MQRLFSNEMWVGGMKKMPVIKPADSLERGICIELQEVDLRSRTNQGHPIVRG